MKERFWGTMNPNFSRLTHQWAIRLHVCGVYVLYSTGERLAILLVVPKLKTRFKPLMVNRTLLALI